MATEAVLPSSLGAGGAESAQQTKSAPSAPDHDTTSKNPIETLLKTWIRAPYDKVGSNSTPLDQAPNRLDTASLTGAKTQTFTTYNCVGRSIILLYIPNTSQNTQKEGDTGSANARGVTNKQCVHVTDLTVLRHLYPDLTSVQARMVSNGVYEWCPGSCLLVEVGDTTNCPAPTETLYPDSEASYDGISVDLEEEGEGFGPPPPPPKPPVKKVYTNYYIHSDIIPVRVVGTTSWQTDPTETVPTTPFFASIREKLADSQPTTALLTNLRGPIIRDGASVGGLARFLLQSNESYREVAAMVRVLCMALATDPCPYRIDPTPMRYCRLVEPSLAYGFDGPVIRGPQWKRPAGKILAVPLDIAVAIGLNKYAAALPAPYTYNDLDVAWTMVPITSTFIANRASIPYIASFLDSSYWNGTVNYNWYGTNTGEVKNGSTNYCCMMPSCNSVRIGGPIHTLLVLVDATSGGGEANVVVGGGIVPVWGVGRDAVPVDFVPMFETFWTQANADSIPRQCASAYTELCARLGSDTSCGEAISLASELYLGNQPGISVLPNGKEHSYSTDAMGAYCFGGGYLDPGQKRLKSGTLPILPPASTDTLSGMLCGFNFGVQTPLHRSPSGKVRLQYITSDEPNAPAATFRFTAASGTWNVNGYAPKLDLAVPAYNASTCSSMMRLSIITGLVSVAGHTYLIKTGPGLSNFVNMNGLALYAITSHYLISSDIDMRIWTGWVGHYENSNGPTQIAASMVKTTSHLCNWIDMDTVAASTGDWTWNRIGSYFGIATGSVYWGSNSNIPLHFFDQWANKMSLYRTSAPDTPYDNYYSSTLGPLFGVTLTQAQSNWRPLIVGTVDFHRYAPIVYCELVGVTPSTEEYFIENWSYLSSVALVRVMRDSECYESMVYGRTLLTANYVTSGSNLLLALDSRFSVRGNANRLLRTNDILYPDPLSIGDFLRGVRDYVLIPAAIGLATTLATGNPIAGVGAVGSSIVSSIQKDITKSEIQAAKSPQVEERKELPKEGMHLEAPDKHAESRTASVLLNQTQ